MNEATSNPVASHVNQGTSVPRSELAWPDHQGPVLTLPKAHVEQSQRADVTALGGLVLPVELLKRFGFASVVDERVSVLKRYVPFHESDHVQAMALMLYAGGTCIEDMSLLQNDSAALKMLGACRTPDPTTAGDFLRRFADEAALRGLRESVDELTERVMRETARKEKLDKLRYAGQPKPRRMAVVDLDGHLEETTGNGKEEADFNYKGKFSLCGLVASLDNRVCLGVRLRPGCARSSEGAAELLDEVLPRLRQHYADILVRADSDFDRSDVRKACERHNAYYAFVGRDLKNRPKLAAACQDWETFTTRARRKREAKRATPGHKRRQGRKNRRRQRARERGYTDLSIAEQHVAETETRYGARLVVRRQLLNVEKGPAAQRELFQRYRFRYVVTNLPDTWSSEQVIDETYKRCDQENMIEQLGSGVAMWRLPTGDISGNKAWVEIARLAWNLRLFVTQLALPDEAARWEWKRFRRVFLYVAAQVIHHARQLRVRLLGSGDVTEDLHKAHARMLC